MATNETVALLLRRMSQGDRLASDELFAALYDELRGMAGWFLRRERPNHTLQPTALVGEVYLRMLGNLEQDWNSRGHFFATAGAVMRSILVDHARSRGAAKRGGSAIAAQLTDDFAASDDNLDLILSVDSALEELQKRDPRQARIVLLRFFAGLTEEETALVLNTSDRTVKRDWKLAKAWLKAELGAYTS